MIRWRTSSASKGFSEPVRIAVTGTTGRVGAALVRHFVRNHEVIPLPRSVCDLEDPHSLASCLAGVDCDVFVNPAGLTSLELCEDDPALAMRLNAEAPGEIAAWAADRGIPVFHFSTDYVFGGETEALLTESDATVPVNIYGKSKLAGEDAVLTYPGNCVIRVSWVFGPEKVSFADQVGDAALEGRALAAISDKFSLPVYTKDLAEWMERLVETGATGIVHACQSGEPVSWHGMAKVVVEELAACGAIRELPRIEEQSLAGMTAFRATRPRFTAMDTRRISELLGHPPRDWREALAEYVRRTHSRG